MTDLLLVLMTMAVVLYAAFFIKQNDGDGNALPDKTLMAMKDDKAGGGKRGSRRFRRHDPRTPEPDVNFGRGQ